MLNMHHEKFLQFVDSGSGAQTSVRVEPENFFGESFEAHLCSELYNSCIYASML